MKNSKSTVSRLRRRAFCALERKRHPKYEQSISKFTFRGKKMAKTKINTLLIICVWCIKNGGEAGRFGLQKWGCNANMYKKTR